MRAREAGARARMRSLQGVFSQQVHGLTEAVIALRVYVEAAIDFPEEEIDFLADPRSATQFQEVRSELAELLREAQRGLRHDGLRVAIIGRPNAGKSSLLNALAGSDRAIVTPLAGTTRDVLRESLSLDGIALDLADTAGLRETDDEVEREGVRRAHGELQRADVALLVTDSEHAQADLALFDKLPKHVEQLLLINKIDLDEIAPRSERRGDSRWLWASAKTGSGLDALRHELKQLAGAGSGEGAFSARRRHVLALQQVAVHTGRRGGWVRSRSGRAAQPGVSRRLLCSRGARVGSAISRRKTGSSLDSAVDRQGKCPESAALRAPVGHSVR